MIKKIEKEILKVNTGKMFKTMKGNSVILFKLALLLTIHKKIELVELKEKRTVEKEKDFNLRKKN